MGMNWVEKIGRILPQNGAWQTAKKSPRRSCEEGEDGRPGLEGFVARKTACR